MLVQSFEDRVLILPALPKAWSKGSVKGIGLIGNAYCDITWEDHKATKVVIHAVEDFETTVKFGETTYQVKVSAGKDYQVI